MTPITRFQLGAVDLRFLSSGKLAPSSCTRDRKTRGSSHDDQFLESVAENSVGVAREGVGGYSVTNIVAPFVSLPFVLTQSNDLPQGCTCPPDPRCHLVIPSDAPVATCSFRVAWPKGFRRPNHQENRESSRSHRFACWRHRSQFQ